MTDDQINEAMAKDPEAYAQQGKTHNPHPDIMAALALVGTQLYKAAASKGFDAAHDDCHTDKSLAITAAFLLEDYCEPGWQEEWTINRHTLLKKAGRDPWPAAYAHRKFNDSLELQRLVVAAQFTVSEIARVLRAQRVVARNTTGEKKVQDWREAAYERDCP